MKHTTILLILLAVILLCAWNLTGCAILNAVGDFSVVPPLRTEADVLRSYGKPTSVPREGVRNDTVVWRELYYEPNEWFVICNGKVTGHRQE